MKSGAGRAALLIGLLGGALTAVLAVTLADATLVFTIHPALLALWVTVVGTLTAVAVKWGALRRRRAIGQAVEAAEARARDEHRSFLRRLDHEVKNPLTAIRAAIDSLAPDDPAVAVVRAQGERLGRLLRDLRTLADLDSVEIERAPVNLEEVASDAAEAVRDEAQAAGRPRPDISLVFPTTPWPIPEVLGDVDLLLLAMHNVVANAVKYSPAGAAVEVRAHEVPGAVVLDVADQGIGIPPSELDLVWSELGRASNARALPGSGVGLALVAAILRRHGGRATLASLEGTGTRVSLVVPTGR
ncbi:sensor histidine kinase [Buchananella hordeovulneris]|uniref:sensor histidine kinase n=1 Tax=Buchananella hordeovulneris TaxID=52770 RepID=UPI000A06FD17|nr:sensor histidine kinase [Buchananella hordeovulneris]MDO5080508.1 sensor histidine kinase [Buchananella hordeovulneris]RRD44613.1 sensor histidine kinase [Buchananella hordeovulneris]